VNRHAQSVPKHDEGIVFSCLPGGSVRLSSAVWRRMFPEQHVCVDVELLPGRVVT
jgi:hypothetical protein